MALAKDRNSGDQQFSGLYGKGGTMFVLKKKDEISY